MGGARLGSRLAALALLAWAGAAAGAEIQGQAVHPEGAAETAGLQVRLLGLTPEGEPVARDGRTDSSGRFRFDDLDVPAAYLILVQYRDVGFHGESVRFSAEQGGESRQVEIAVHAPSDDPSAIVLDRIRIFIDREPGLYRLDQVVELRNTGERVVLVDGEAEPALRIALARGHGELRTPTGLTPSGFVLGDGVLELRGPVFSGPRELVFSYDLAPAGSELHSELLFPDGVPELELYVVDERYAIDAGPLHPARVTRDADGTVYQRFVGFDLPAGTRIPLSLRPLPPIPRTGSWGSAAAAALVAGALLVFVGRPVTSTERIRDEPAEDAEATSKEALFAALRDLEHDFETGKLSAGDRDRLREELRRDALAELARTRRTEAASPAPERACRSCGRKALEGDGFCSGCGSAI